MRKQNDGVIILLVLLVIAMPVAIFIWMIKGIAKAIERCSNNPKPQITNKQSNTRYEKIFPHLTTDDTSSDEEKELDDYLFMDLMDDDF